MATDHGCDFKGTFWNLRFMIRRNTHSHSSLERGLSCRVLLQNSRLKSVGSLMYNHPYYLYKASRKFQAMNASSESSYASIKVLGGAALMFPVYRLLNLWSLKSKVKLLMMINRVCFELTCKSKCFGACAPPKLWKDPWHRHCIRIRIQTPNRWQSLLESQFHRSRLQWT